jgi:ABC-type maltose transport system permease subunit
MTDPMRMAASVLLMIPVMILFLLFHEKMLGNLSVGGIKE